MKPIFVGFILLFLLLFVSSVSTADSIPPATATQSISANAQGYSASITAPISITDWSLTRGGNNDKYIGTVQVSSDAPTTWDMVVTADADDTNWITHTENTLFVATSYTESTVWNDFITGGIVKISETGLKSPNNLATKTNIPVYLRQVVGSEPSGDYTLTITYSLSVTEPATP